MEPPKVILFYCFTPLEDPDAIRLWQHTLCESLDLKGRILISHHGMNVTLGGTMASLKSYLKATKGYRNFMRLDVKWSEGLGQDFPRLRVRVRDELVTFGAPGELKVNEHGVVGGGIRLTPSAVNQLVAERGDDVVFFDARNAFEAKIGKFKNAIVPEVRATRDFVAIIERGTYDHLKDRPIVTYCTGGVRCEVLSSLMKNRGFTEVYQIDGGIVRYGETFGDQGLWEGSLYLFDARMHQEFSDAAVTIGRCERCDALTSQFHNCANLECRKLILLCDACKDDNIATSCTPSHQDL